jgi:hypothetical protein
LFFLQDVPTRLANNIRNQISDEVNLRVPDGKTYPVQVSKEDNGLVFRTGWAAFSSAYELEQGDILLFQSSGSSCFEVRIFDQSCCEKESSCVAMNNTPSVHERSMSHDTEMQSPGNERLAKTLQFYHLPALASKIMWIHSIFDILAYTYICLEYYWFL